MYARFGHHLLHIYRIEVSGKLLAGQVAVNYLSTAINLASNKFKAVGSAETRLFFLCLDEKSTSEQAKWLSGLKMNMHREAFGRVVEAGGPIDKSESKRPCSHPVCMCTSRPTPRCLHHSHSHWYTLLEMSALVHARVLMALPCSD